MVFHIANFWMNNKGSFTNLGQVADSTVGSFLECLAAKVWKDWVVLNVQLFFFFRSTSGGCCAANHAKLPAKQQRALQKSLSRLLHCSGRFFIFCCTSSISTEAAVESWLCRLRTFITCVKFLLILEMYVSIYNIRAQRNNSVISTIIFELRKILLIAANKLI